ncbi:MAG: flagellar basal body rod protein FlgC [Proteobacteria bacterium]|nr:flagellar basal body rod protein FlgC [Pseudomonadota bacterium]
MSGLIKSMLISSSGMQAQSHRLLVIAQNLANAGTKAPKLGEHPYQRKTVTFKNVYDPKTGVEKVELTKINHDLSPFPLVYSPGDPGANENGYVEESNVKPMIEMADMREASRSHEANLRAYEKALAMLQDTISLLKS